MKGNPYFSPNVTLTGWKTLSDIHRWKLRIKNHHWIMCTLDTWVYIVIRIYIIILTIPSALLVNIGRNFSFILFLTVLKRLYKCWNESNFRGVANQAFQIGTTNNKKIH